MRNIQNIDISLKEIVKNIKNNNCQQQSKSEPLQQSKSAPLIIGLINQTSFSFFF